MRGWLTPVTVVGSPSLELISAEVPTMPNAQVTITLSVEQTGAPPATTYLYHVLVDGQLVAGNIGMSAADSEAVRDLSGQYNALFEEASSPEITADALDTLGSELFGRWLAKVWDRVTPLLAAGARRQLVVASDVPDVLNLPWELLRPPGGTFVGTDPKYALRRTPKPLAVLPPSGSPPGPPLRVLFMACAPTDQVELDYEREEEAMLAIMAKAGPNLAFDSGDLGTFDEVQERIVAFRPHIVHLTGHGVVQDDGLGYFAFENEHGGTDLRSSEEIRQQLFAGGGVQCAFVSGCQTGNAPAVAAVGGICQGLVSEDVPLAIGWAASVADDLATSFADRFYRLLAAGEAVDRALTLARQSVQPKSRELGDPTWTLPVLYAATAQATVHDPKLPLDRPARPNPVQQPLPGMSEGYAESFVGRRRELQRLVPALSEGRSQIVILTGMGGTGKSTLATRLARRLERDGYTLITVPSTTDKPLRAALLLQACGDAFLASGLDEAHALLRSDQLPVADRLRYLVTTLNRGRFVLVLDNFEVNLNEVSRRIQDQEVAAFYNYLLASLTGGSRALITSRYLPADVDRLPRTVHEEPLGEFPEAAFLKFL